ncbi:helix-turn-helix domain-containing protein [Leptothrix discophora]|uniref:Helix-turn-helix domain-containing protein n=1 Tax=Leptothrix discophora TaxID=89 RepID=A0ABT9FYR8_LEPDI|nr:helix-turn-helix domain-containing protein [Leptothrix discophora]MDP4299177.1 helix-turn-helix domain-containing protein [Leptothrix discophora]
MNSRIPNYALYGHEAQPAWLDMVHIEQIHERSSMHDYRIDPHVHDGMIQVLYLTQGGGDVLIDGERHTLRAPALIVVPSRHVHGFDWLPEVDGPVVTAAQRPLESIAAVAAPALVAQIRKPLAIGLLDDVGDASRHAEALLPLFQALDRETRVHPSGVASAGMALLLAVFVQIARIQAVLHSGEDGEAGTRNRKAAQVERFRAMVDERYRERLSLDDYASPLGISAGQLSRLCREVLGMSALDVISARVVHEAERELVYSILSVKQIAALLGYADEAYFGRFFKKQTGCTPTEFRELAQAQLAPPRRAPVAASLD